MRALISFIPLFKKQLHWMLLGMLLSTLTAIFGVALLSLSGWFLSAAAYAGLVSALAWQFNYLLPAAGVRSLSMLRILGRYGERVVSHQATFKVLTDVRVWFYQKLEPLAPAHLMEYRSGDLLARMVGDVDALDNLYLRVLVPSAVVITTSFIVFLFFACFSWQVAWLTLLMSLGVSFLVPGLTGWLAKQASSQLAFQQANLKTMAVEYLQGLAELKTFSQEQKYVAQFAEQQRAFLASQQRMSKFSGLSSALMTLSMGLTMLLVLWVAVHLVNAHVLNGALLAFLALGVMGLFEVIRPLPAAYQYLGKTVASAHRILAIVDKAPKVVFPVNETVNLSEYTMSVKGIDFAYQDRQAIFQQFSLDIPQGRKLAIVGDTGAGKSTLLQLLSRCWDVDAGQITIGGVDIKALTETQLRCAVSVLSQRPHIFNTSIRENLLIANSQASDAELWQSLDAACLSLFVKNLPNGLDSWVGEHGRALSGGQQKRLALARIFLKPAPIIILDEPTEGLDRITEEKVFASIQSWASNKTMILISHHPRLIKHMSHVVNLSTSNFF